MFSALSLLCVLINPTWTGLFANLKRLGPPKVGYFKSDDDET